MEFQYSLAYFFLLCIIAYPVQGELSVDLSLRVVLPVVICAIIIIMLIIVCYCIYKRSNEYDSILNSDSSSNESYQIEIDLPKDEFISGLEEPRNVNEHNYGTLFDRGTVSADNDQSQNFQKKNEFIEEKFKLYGLQNVKSECYINSVMQVLASSKNFIQFLNQTKEAFNECEILKTLLNLIEGLNNTDGTGSVENNSKLLNEFIRLINWNKFNQQDAFDFLTATINAIHNEIKKMEIKIDPPLKMEVIYRTLGLNASEKVQYNIGLSLNLNGLYQKRPGVELVNLIKQYFDISIIDEDETQTSQIFFYRQIPTVLILHIQANRWNMDINEMVKPIYYIQYNENMKLELPVKVERTDDKLHVEQCEYKLIAIIHHSGTVSNGHYVTYRKFKDSWILANDIQIEVVKFDLKVIPYLLIYEKI